MRAREKKSVRERWREMERDKKREILCEIEISSDEQAYHCNFE